MVRDHNGQGPQWQGTTMDDHNGEGPQWTGTTMKWTTMGIFHVTYHHALQLWDIIKMDKSIGIFKNRLSTPKIK